MSKHLAAVHAALSAAILGAEENMVALVAMPLLTLAGNPVKGEKPVGLLVDDDNTIGTSQELRKLSPTIRKAMVEYGATPGRNRWSFLAWRSGAGVDVLLLEAALDMDLRHGSFGIHHRNVWGKEFEAPKLVVSSARLSSDGTLSSRIEGEPYEDWLSGGAPWIDVPLPKEATRWMSSDNVGTSLALPLPSPTQIEDICREAVERREGLESPTTSPSP